MPLNRRSGGHIPIRDNFRRRLGNQDKGMPPSSCPVAQDFVFLVDSSASVGEENFLRARNFLKELLNGLPGPPVRSGVVQFEDQIQLISPLQENRTDLLLRVDLMEFSIGETRMAPALEQAATMLGSASRQAEKVVVVIGDGAPNDADHARQQAAHLKSLNARVSFVYINHLASDSSDTPAVMEEMASEPIPANIFPVDSYASLGTKVPAILSKIISRCPCRKGTKVSVQSPDGEQAELSTTAIIPHDGSHTLECSTYFPLYTGPIKLLCEDSSIQVVTECSRTCDPNVAVNISIRGMLATIFSAGRIAHRASEERPCAQVAKNFSGLVRLECFEGRVIASHTCGERCPASLPMEAGHEQKSVDLGVPSEGLDHGNWTSERCEDHFAGTTGSVGLLCLDGKLQMMKQCSPVCPVQTEEIPLTWVVVSISSIAVGFTMLGAAIALFWRIRRKDPSVRALNLQPEQEERKVASPTSSLGDGAISLPHEAQHMLQGKSDDKRGINSMAPMSHILSSTSTEQRSLLPVFPEPKALCDTDSSPSLTPLMRSVDVQAMPMLDCTEVQTTMNVRDAALQTTPKVLEENAFQTQPQVYVELIRGMQRPLDVVCCIDSSVSVGREDFLKSVRFLEHIIRELEMPPVQMGVIRFHHSYSVISPLTSNRDSLLSSLRELDFEAGETKLGPPLHYARKMLQVDIHDDAAAIERPMKVVIVVTDGDPNDLPDTQVEAAALKRDGVAVLFIHIGDEVQPEIIRHLASSPAERYVFSLRSYDELPDASTHVLKSIVDVSLWVRRAKFSGELSTYTEVADINTVVGHELMCPGWEPRGPEQWFWEPRAGRCIEDARVVPWDAKSSRPIIPVPEPAAEPTTKPLALQDAVKPVSLSTASTQTDGFPEICKDVAPVAKRPTPKMMQVAAQTDSVVQVSKTHVAAQTVPVSGTHIEAQTVPVSGTHVAAQTDPVVQVRLEPWRHAPLDLVICVDSSASFCLERKVASNEVGGVFVESGTFQRAKEFVERLASCVDMPEVRLGLIRFEDRHEVVCPLTNELQDFVTRLQGMGPMPGETKLAPPLRRASKLLADTRDSEARKVDWASSFKVAKAVLVITDGDPNDFHDTMDVVHCLRQQGVQLLFVKVGRDGAAEKLEKLASPLPWLLSSSTTGEAQTSQPPRGVFESASNDSEHLLALIPDVMQQLVRVTRRVAHAHYTIPMAPYQELVGEAKTMADNEILLSESKPWVDPHPVNWPFIRRWEVPATAVLQKDEPRVLQKAEPSIHEEARKDSRTQLEQAELHIRRLSAEVSSAHDSKDQVLKALKGAQEALKDALERADNSEKEKEKLGADLQVTQDRLQEAHAALDATKAATKIQSRVRGDEGRKTAAQQRDKKRQLQAQHANASRKDSEDASLRKALIEVQGDLDIAKSCEAQLRSRLQGAEELAKTKEQENTELRKALQETQERLDGSKKEEAAMQVARLDDAASQALAGEALSKAIAEKDAAKKEAAKVAAEKALADEALAKVIAEKEAEKREAEEKVAAEKALADEALAKAIAEKDAAEQARVSDLQARMRSAEKMADALAYILATSMGWQSDTTSIGIVPDRRIPSSMMEVAELAMDDEASCIVSGASASEPLVEPTPSSSEHESAGSKRSSSKKALRAQKDTKETVQWIRAELVSRYGDLTSAFKNIDSNKSRQITKVELTQALAEFGATRSFTQALWRRLSQLAHCEKSGALTLEDWLIAFNADTEGQSLQAASKLIS